MSPVGRETGGGVAPVLYSFSFVSGAAALFYEIAWSKLLSLTFGSTTLAVSAVVAGFLGGMGIGAWLYQRAWVRVESALRLYAVLEFGIAAAALLLTLALPALPQLFASVAGALPQGLGLVLLRYACVFTLLLVPAALMGATFPALCTVLIRSRVGVGRHLGTLYGLNTVGAAAGALVAGIFAIERLGLRGTVLVANAINLAIGAAALLLARRVDERRVEADASPDAPLARSRLPVPLIAAVLFLSGFATLAYEVLWFRALRYLFGNSTYALTVMLVAFLTGLGFGALLFRSLASRGSTERSLALCQLGIGVLALAAIGGVAALLASDAPVSIFFGSIYEAAWGWRLLVHGGIALGVMLPATACMGLCFPLATSLLLSSRQRLGARVGGAVLLANLGGILGALLASVAILPALGTVGGTRALALLSLGLGLGVLLFLDSARTTRVAWGLSGAVLVGALALALPERLVFRGSGMAPRDGEVVFEQEGDLATIQVWQDREQPELKGMSIDGTIIGASLGWNYPVYSKQLLLAHLPLALDERIRSVVTIGLGSASTVEALVRHRGLETIDVVEINAGVVEAAELFPESAALRDERVRVIVDDALHLLLVSPRRYDAIVSDGKQAADFSGNAKLLAREFYELCLERLSEHGLFAQWIPLSTPPREFRVVLRTATRVFPHLEVFYDAPTSAILVGSRRPLAGRPRLATDGFRGGIRVDLARLGIADAAALGSRWIASRPQLVAVLGDGRTSTWDHSPLEFAAYRSRPSEWRRGVAANIRLLTEANELGPSPAGAELAPRDTPRVRSQQLLRRAQQRSHLDDPRGALRLARQAVAANPEDANARRWLEHFRAEAAPGLRPAPR